MKNKHMEHLKSMWKNAKRRVPHKDGVIIYHVYEEHKKYSWWDDFGFYINGVYYVVWWLHPRMVYKDRVNDEAHKNMEHLRPERNSDWLIEGTKNYIKLGNSRKKCVSTTMPPTSKAFAEWYELLKVEESRIAVDNDIVVTPSIKTTWLSYGKGIDICYPVELLDEQDIVEFANDIKQYILYGKPLNFGNYTYTKDDWIAEGHEVY